MKTFFPILALLAFINLSFADDSNGVAESVNGTIQNVTTTPATAESNDTDDAPVVKATNPAPVTKTTTTKTVTTTKAAPTTNNATPSATSSSSSPSNPSDSTSSVPAVVNNNSSSSSFLQSLLQMLLGSTSMVTPNTAFLPGSLSPSMMPGQSVAGGGSFGGSASGGSSTTPTLGQLVPGQDNVAAIQQVQDSGARSAMAVGTVTINGHAYEFRSGGFGNGYLPEGTYNVDTPQRRDSQPGMNVDGYGYSFNLSDQYDTRVGAERSLLRIHPDGGSPGTNGCMGIVGDVATQQQFFNDMNTVLQQSGGSTQIYVRYS